MINSMKGASWQGFTQHLGPRCFTSIRAKRIVADLSAGFTIIELLIATTIFSVLLLVSATAVVQVGRTYYKGVSVTQTAQTARQILAEVSANIRLNSTVSGLNTASGGRSYYCVGGHRYTFKLFNHVNSADHDNSTKFGLLQDQPVGDGCGNPFDSPAIPLVNPTELLANNMRLLNFTITPLAGAGSLYSVALSVASGADDTLSDPNSASAQCKNQPSLSQFCAVTSLSTVVYQGLNI